MTLDPMVPRPLQVTTVGLDVWTPGWGIVIVTPPVVSLTAATMLVTAALRSGRSFWATM